MTKDMKNCFVLLVRLKVGNESKPEETEKSILITDPPNQRKKKTIKTEYTEAASSKKANAEQTIKLTLPVKQGKKKLKTNKKKIKREHCEAQDDRNYEKVQIITDPPIKQE